MKKLLYASNNFLRNFSRTRFNDVNIYKEIYKVDPDSWLVDRTGTIKFPWATKLLDRYQHIEKTESVDFETCCLLTATKYLTTNKPIILLWSGGIDSTSMVVSFLRATNDYSNITIAFNNESIREYPLFYKKYICGKIKGISTEELMLKTTTSGIGDSILLSAEHADTLFGAGLIGTGLENSLGVKFLYGEFNRKNFTTFFVSKGASELSANCWFDIFKATTGLSPKPIETMFDMAWWHGFNFKWQAVGLKMDLRFNQDIDYRTFYSDPSFQQWSIDRSLDTNNIKDLKIVPKEFIFKFTNDSDYRDYKIKSASSTLYYAKPSAVAILDDYTKVSNFDVMDYYQPDNFIAAWLTNNQNKYILQRTA